MTALICTRLLNAKKYRNARNVKVEFTGFAVLENETGDNTPFLSTGSGHLYLASEILRQPTAKITPAVPLMGLWK